MTGTTVDQGRIVLGERLRAGSSDEVRTGFLAADPSQRVLVTLTARHAESYATLADRLELPFSGIAALELVGPAPAPYADVLVETLPEGLPAIERIPVPRADLCRLGAQLAAVVARVHAAGQLVGAIRPELVYTTDRLELSALVPRGPGFIASAPQPMHGRRTYAVPYSSPEVLTRTSSGPATEVFALAATLFTLGSGKHPYGNDADAASIAKCILVGKPAPWSDGGSLGDLFERSFDRDPKKRPTAQEICNALEASRPS